MPLLQEVARVKIDPFLLSSKPLSFRKKHDLRIEVIKRLINDTPFGKHIKISDFQKAGHFSTAGQAYAFVAGMVKRGTIVKQQISPRKFYYTVPGQMKIMTGRSPELDEAGEIKPAHGEPVAEPEQPQGGVQPVSQPTDLEGQAMRYLWYKPDGDVRDFVKWINSQGEK